ncbi:hypothetical protein J2S19_000568 [Metabacillus malikii]|uniref:Uncharacterized protein n=1 Tax=Metabacillus malikii TaxID=1504265 RepID=A0ABT9ZAP8_9BACI|nr:hypothetical protein [Metabacillus malikii]
MKPKMLMELKRKGLHKVDEAQNNNGAREKRSS